MPPALHETVSFFLGTELSLFGRSERGEEALRGGIPHVPFFVRIEVSTELAIN